MRPKCTQQTKKQTKTSGLIYHENFKQKTLVCNLQVCSEDHRYVQTGENNNNNNNNNKPGAFAQFRLRIPRNFCVTENV
jgi:hypothetical protein